MREFNHPSGGFLYSGIPETVHSIPHSLPVAPASFQGPPFFPQIPEDVLMGKKARRSVVGGWSKISGKP